MRKVPQQIFGVGRKIALEETQLQQNERVICALLAIRLQMIIGGAFHKRKKVSGMHLSHTHTRQRMAHALSAESSAGRQTDTCISGGYLSGTD